MALNIRIKAVVLLCLGTAVYSHSALAQSNDSSDAKQESKSKKPESLSDKVKGMEEREGFFTFYWDEKSGKIFLKIAQWQEFLYVQSLATGLGSNPVGLDRGQLGKERIVRFQRVGPRVVLQQRNLRFRAESNNAAERRAVEESFATSVLAGFKIEAEDENGAVLVDLTSFLMQDAHGAIGTLKSAKQGSFKLNSDRSYVYLPRTKAFPRNSEFEVALTLTSSDPGNYVRETAPTPQSVTMRQHHSFIALPEPGYRPRRWDPRIGTFKVSYADYAADIGEPLWQHLVVRHRLAKRDPDAAVSLPVKPIVYYVDSGAPPKIQQALLDGARWWNAAFEGAGYKNAFQVRVLPKGVDPLDVRYNVIQWVHRSTRGWSYGQSVVDPRTGEILKGHVLLGSLRVHQDHLLMDGLVKPSVAASGRCQCCGIAGRGDEFALASLDPQLSSTEVALARIRQLSAHEVGHTIGFAHNFAASTYGDRASVMDYPAPRVKLGLNGTLDMSDAYGVGVGSWDRFVTEYAYRDFPDTKTEERELKKLVDKAVAKGMLYLSDADARPAGAAHPLANLWDNGRDPVAELEHVMHVRSIAIQRFGLKNIDSSRPRAELELVFVPLYLHHRYQVDATAKSIGGAYYDYGLVSDQDSVVKPVSVERQRAALTALLKTIDPKNLVISPRIQRLLLPRSFSGLLDRERFNRRTSPVFDPLATAEVAAGMTVNNILQPQRLARLIAQQQSGWGIEDVCKMLFDNVWSNAPLAERRVQRVVQLVVIRRMISVAGNAQTDGQVRAALEHQLREVSNRIQAKLAEAEQSDVIAQLQFQDSKIKRFLARPNETGRPTNQVDPPPGSPIGSELDR